MKNADILIAIAVGALILVPLFKFLVGYALK